MKKIRFWSLILSLVLGLSGCYKEGALHASMENEKVYSEYDLPQGDHDYDKDILEMFKKYNTLFLYKYNPKDIYYNTDEYVNGTYFPEKDSTAAGLFDVPSDEAWVGKQVKLLQELWLDYYPEEFLRQQLPLKVFLVDSLYSAKSGYGSPVELLNNNYLVCRGVDYILVTYGSSRIDEMTKADKYEFKRVLHRVFLDYLDIPVTVEFAAIGNYTIFSNVNNKPYIYRYGFINWDNSSTPQRDWFSYIDAIVDHSYEEWVSDGPSGFLHPSKDTQGKIREKYNLVIEFFKTNYQIDLQKISNDLSSYGE